jgi:hypothetical protein
VAYETIYMLQTFDLAGPRTFRFDKPVLYPQLREALGAAEEIRGKAGLIIHEVAGDADQLEWKDPIVVHEMGAVPVGIPWERRVAAHALPQPEIVQAPARAPVEAQRPKVLGGFVPLRPATA